MSHHIYYAIPLILAAILAYAGFMAWLGKRYPAPHHDLDEQVRALSERLQKQQGQINSLSMKMGMSFDREQQQRA